MRSLLPLFVDTEMVTRDGVRTSSVAHLGVRLTAEDVAAAVSPTWANRLVVARVSR